MICEKCKDRRHEECKGRSWCDCQHQDPRRPAEPGVGWRRQG
ncbi:hypothetical protein HNP84_000760 [Thermocatellispora tengchongensis]|uniref:Uncharacterized protein n=1 Tax=Thermocatellispora tengchongensis TaxID=1073253 RepID=A0A840NR15_9ACTN|nr:hypothetical protein [Thermocatellispora tengchongensis]MBB5131054.1 hypothetical protein [Thermocatellispora tengchongensis]